MLYQLSAQSEAVLRTIQKLGNATLKDVVAAAGADSKPAVYSLKKCGHIQVTKTLMRVVAKNGKSESRPVSVFSLTDKGHAAIRRMDFPPVEKTPPPPPQKQELHQMQYFIIPDFAPNVTEGFIEVDGRQVKCTRGVQFKYETYVQPQDHSRNYTPRPIRWIHAL